MSDLGPPCGYESEHGHLPGEFDPQCGMCIDQAADEAARRGLGVEAALTNAERAAPTTGAASPRPEPRHGATGGFSVIDTSPPIRYCGDCGQVVTDEQILTEPCPGGLS